MALETVFHLFLIFPRVNFKQYMLKGAPTVNVSGWSNEEIFLEYFDHFLAHAKSSVADKQLLILDNHVSHFCMTY
ncbi:hypothetical protein PR048_004903 [Dryococelus australis]|uniref:DDE-1 domain-containing protein n=1 Tax=Dryococelus australis TaxID=614101 RepID=A0ABQ9I6P7_9NEOP|nr:hypothetical protein PR048_004903 [Dryococelus australis]